MHDLKPRQKRKARIRALQAIYSQEFSPSDLDTTFEHIQTFFEDEINNREEKVNNNGLEKEILYSKHLCMLTNKYSLKLDEIIKERSKNWDISRITLIDRIILRMSLAEMLYENKVPPKVSITEGVEIAKEFSTQDSSGFINGILDSVYNEICKVK